MKNIPYGRQNIGEEDLEAVCSVLRSDWLTQGPKVREFEEALAEQCGARHCIVVSNGTMALHIACLALDIAPGDIGLTSPISFLASANCIAYCGGTPDFVDIDTVNLCLSPDLVEKYCREKKVPKVVIPVDFAGVPADLPRLKGLADRYGFKLIEDAAHSIGSLYSHQGEDYGCGSCAHTDMAIFSFHPVKSVTSGEGGAIMTNDDGLARKIRLLTNHGIERDPSNLVTGEKLPVYYHEMQVLGFNGRITDIQCALGMSQLRRLKRFKARRQEIVMAYNRGLNELEENGTVALPPWPNNTDPCYHLYTLRLKKKSRISRDDLFQRLRDKGIFCQVHYIPIYQQPFYQEKYGYSRDDFPEAEKYYRSCISLPLFFDLSDSDLQYIIDALIQLLR